MQTVAQQGALVGFLASNRDAYAGALQMPSLGSLGELLKAARTRRGLSQGNLVKKLDYSLTTYRKLEAGQLTKGPGPGVLGDLSRILQVPVSDMYRAAGWLQADPDEEARLLELWAQIAPEDRGYMFWLVRKVAGAHDTEEATTADSRGDGQYGTGSR